MKLKTYPEYKDSGAPWLGEVPEHWGIRKIKYLFSERVQKGFPDEPLLAATQTKGVVQKDHYENRTVLAQKDLHLLKLVKLGDFVISLRSFQGGIEYAYHQGMISPAYTVMVPTSPIISNYFRHLAKSRTFIGLLKTCVTGMREGQNIDYTRLRRSSIPLPSEVEQNQIARFLDHKTHLIANFICNKERLIELLQEQKQAIISHAVTRSIDPDVRLKPSGIDWLGDVPEHWEVRRLKFVCKEPLKYGANEVSGYVDEGAPRFVRITDIDEDGNLRDNTICTISNENAEGFLLTEGDILFARSGATVGKTFIYKKDWGAAAFAGYLIRARIDPRVAIAEYIYAFTRSGVYSTWKNSIFVQATIQNISAEKYSSLFVPVPPLTEQACIVEWTSGKNFEIDSSIAHTRRQIDLIREYRTRLIADVVTGKVDVRDIPVEDVPEDEALEEFVESREIEEALDIGEIQDAKQ